MAAKVGNEWQLPRFSRADQTAGESSAPFQFGDILTEHLDALYSYSLVLSRDPTEAEDLVQETCARAIPAMGRLREQNNNVKGWLFKILRNIWLNQLRQQRAAPRLIELDVDESAADIAVEKSEDSLAAYIRKVERARVRRAIQQLPQHFREIVVLREFEELSYEDIAKVLECPVGTVMSRLARARAKLRELLLEAHNPSSQQEAQQPYEDPR